MIDVVADAELQADQLRDAGAGPQVGREAMGLGALEQVAIEPFALAEAELGRAARTGLGRQTFRPPLFVAGAPAANGTAIDADTLGDLNRCESLLQQGEGSLAALGQGRGASVRSHGYLPHGNIGH